MALGSHRGSFRVALGWLWGRNRLPINTLWGGFGLALGGFVRPFFILHSSFCPRLRVAWRGGAWGLQIADCKWPIARPVALFGFSFQISAFQLLPECGLGWLWPAVQGSRFRVQGSRFHVHHKHPKYNSPLPPPSGWTGGTLVPPWTYPGTIGPLPDLLFDQARLFKSVSSGFSVAQPYLGLDVGCWMFRVGCSVSLARRSRFAVGLRCPPPTGYT